MSAPHLPEPASGDPDDSLPSQESPVRSSLAENSSLNEPLPPEEMVAEPPQPGDPAHLLASIDPPVPPDPPMHPDPLMQAAPLPRQHPDDGQPPTLFREHWAPPAPPQERIPNFGHLLILGLLALAGLFGAGLLARLALNYHLFGVTTLHQAATEIHFTLGTQAVFYLLTFLGCLLIFPLLWHKGLFAGLQWHAKIAFYHRARLISAAAACFVLALFNGYFMPGPTDTPIDRIFRMPGAAWMLFAFGVTLAPFFEEIAFRGFLLPALATAFDWMAERSEGAPPHPLDQNGHPQWSMPAVIVAAVITSILFAFMHADQTGYAIGPFLLLVCVSLVLCWARLSTRSLAASVLVHACYNFLLFTMMFLGTSGFRHLDNM
ncbi:MAG TPA: CPBP family intramembrane glutamic endopeptidase [Terracidiphilus sp.]|nr:CPBP family intramembrane glutamic endopeptidase [Terracidiphilus sp.]